MGLRWVLVALLCTLIGAPAASASPILVLDGDGRARVVEDPFVPSARDPVPPSPAHGALRAAAEGPTVAGELRRQLLAGEIDRAAHDARRRVYDRARAGERRLTGTRRAELRAVRRTVDAIARSGQLIPSRQRQLFATLAANHRWWTTGPLLVGGRRLGFAGSELVWQYYPGQGIQLQMLASFGKLNGLWRGRTYDERLEVLLDELLALPAERGGGLAWESTFAFDGGRPPWVSALTQGTAVQALARAAIRLRRKDEVFAVARRALTLFELPPPVGVQVPEGDGAHFLLYSFAPELRVLNGFAQAVIGLHDFAAYANDARARGLFEAGERQLRRETPTYDTGAWSLYSRGGVEGARRDLTRESDLGYHRLVRGFLGGLCERTAIDVYCGARDRFRAYETTRPVVALVTTTLRRGRRGRLRFDLSKISRVGVEVRRGGRLVLSRPAAVTGRGRRSVTWEVPRRTGAYAVRVTAVDLAGNVGSGGGSVTVRSRP